MTRSPKLHLEKFLPYRMSVLSNHVSGAIAAAISCTFGLSIPEWRVMACWRESRLVRRGSHRAHGMDKVAVSRAVATLIAAGRCGAQPCRRIGAARTWRSPRRGYVSTRQVVPMGWNTNAAGGIAVGARSRHPRPDSASFARSRRRDRARARGMRSSDRMYNRARLRRRMSPSA